MNAGGLSCGSFTIGTCGLAHMMANTLPHHDDWWSREATLKDLALWAGIFRDNADQVIPVHRVADIHMAKADGKPASC